MWTIAQHNFLSAIDREKTFVLQMDPFAVTIMTPNATLGQAPNDCRLEALVDNCNFCNSSLKKLIEFKGVHLTLAVSSRVLRLEKRIRKRTKKLKLEIVIRATEASQITMICTTPISYWSSLIVLTMILHLLSHWSSSMAFTLERIDKFHELKRWLKFLSFLKGSYIS